MLDSMGVARKKDDSWTVDHNKILKEFIAKFRALAKITTKKEAANDVEILIKNKYPDLFEDRIGTSMSQRIQLFDRVLAGEVDEDKLMEYDKCFYKKMPR